MLALAFSAGVALLGVCLGTDPVGTAAFQVGAVALRFCIQACLGGVLQRTPGGAFKRLGWLVAWAVMLLS